MIFIKKYKKIIIIALLIILNFLGLKQLLLAKSEKEIAVTNWESEDINTDSIKSEVKKIKVDIKGAVARPGVYEMLETDTLNNLILASGGFNSDAYTTNLGLSSILKDGMMVYVYTVKEYQSNGNNKNNSASNNKNSTSKEDKPASSSSSNTSKPKTNYSITSKVPSEKEDSMDNDIANETTNANEKTEETPKKEENKKEEIIEPLVVNINTASIIDLVKLNGIGEAKAAAIINYRNTNGLFKNIEEIMNVKGIGPSIYAKIKEYITI